VLRSVLPLSLRVEATCTTAALRQSNPFRSKTGLTLPPAAGLSPSFVRRAGHRPLGSTLIPPASCCAPLPGGPARCQSEVLAGWYWPPLLTSGSSPHAVPVFARFRHFRPAYALRIRGWFRAYGSGGSQMSTRAAAQGFFPPGKLHRPGYLYRDR